MLESPNLLTTIIAFILVLGPLVVVHELGHYLVGRFFGVKADAFSVGFGKELWGWTDKRGTRWKLSALPLGGYVQFAGDMNAVSMPDQADDGLTDKERAQTFHVKPLWQRSLIVAAGPVTNLLLAIAVFAAFNLAYGKVVSEPVVAGFEAGSTAQQAGLEVGDTVIAIDGEKVANLYEVIEKTAYFPGRTVKFAIERDGESLVIPVPLTSEIESDRFGNEMRVGEHGIDFVAPIAGAVMSGSPAAEAGIEEGDRIVAVDDEKVGGFVGLAETIRGMPGATVELTVERDGQTLELPVTLTSETVTGPDGKEERIGRLGVGAGPGPVVPVGPLEAVTLGVDQSIGIMRMMVTGIGQIFSGERSVKELGGPIKIAKYSGEQFTLGWSNFVGFVALISINLAFINLLPIPALDGGHLAFYAAEAVRRKPLGLRSQEWAFRTGLALVLALMLFVTINDIASLSFFGG